MRYFIVFLVSIFLLFGEIQCIVKMVRCNWDPIGKAEVIYTIGTFTGAGAIVGWFDIQDK